MHKSIDKILTALMDARGINTTDLARQSGVVRSTVSRILNPNGPKGIKDPADKQVKKLADYFSLTTDQLRGHQPIPADMFWIDSETDQITLVEVKKNRPQRSAAQNELEELLSLSTPRTRVELLKIAQASVDGRLTDDDIALLTQIADRLTKKE